MALGRHRDALVNIVDCHGDKTGCQALTLELTSVQKVPAVAVGCQELGWILSENISIHLEAL